jgi:hypothetical protein
MLWDILGCLCLEDGMTRYSTNVSNHLKLCNNAVARNLHLKHGSSVRSCRVPHLFMLYGMDLVLH